MIKQLNNRATMINTLEIYVKDVKDGLICEHKNFFRENTRALYIDTG